MAGRDDAGRTERHKSAAMLLLGVGGGDTEKKQEAKRKLQTNFAVPSEFSLSQVLNTLATTEI